MRIGSALTVLLFWASTASAARPVQNLQKDRLSPVYRNRLAQSGALLFNWTLRQGYNLMAVVCKPMQINQLLIEFVQWLFDNKYALGIAVHAILAVQTRWRPLRGHLRAAWDSVSAWKMSRPVKSRIPIPLPLLRALCHLGCIMATIWDTDRSYLWFAVVVALQTGYHALARPKELLSVLVKHIKLPTVWSLSDTFLAVVNVLDPKNKAYMGRIQVRLIRDVATIKWLQWFTDHLHEDMPLWPEGRLTLVRMFHQLLSLLDLDNLGLGLASLRAGRATAMLEEGCDIHKIQFSGGWGSLRNLACYLQEAESAHAMLSLGPSASARVKHLLDSYSFLTLPPSVPLLGRNGSTACIGGLHHSGPGNDHSKHGPDLSDGHDPAEHGRSEDIARLRRHDEIGEKVCQSRVGVGRTLRRRRRAPAPDTRTTPLDDSNHDCRSSSPESDTGTEVGNT